MARELDLFQYLHDEDAKDHRPSNRLLVPIIMERPYALGVAEAGVKYISAVDRPPSEWLRELREALELPIRADGTFAAKAPLAATRAAQFQAGGGISDSQEVVKSPTLVAMLRAMDAAIEVELEFVRRYTGGRGHVAVDGVAVGNSGGQFLYVFDLKEPWEPQDDAPIRVKLEPPARHLDASIVTSTGNKITIAVSGRLPEVALHEVTLKDDPTRILEKLREALGDVREPPSQLASKAFKLLPARTGTAPLPELPSGFAPRPSQQRAMRMALGNEVTYIIGPPGTGKTDTLAALTYALIKAGQSVLIAAHTNIAVDNAIVKLADFAKELPALQAGRIVRFGAPQLGAVKGHPYIYPPSIAKREGQALDKQKEEILGSRVTILARLHVLARESGGNSDPWHPERERLVQHVADFQAEIGPLRQQEETRVADLRARLALAQREVQTTEPRVESAKQALAELVAQQSQFHVQRARIQTDEARMTSYLAEAQQINPIARVVRGASPHRLAHQLSDLKQKLWQIDQALSATQLPLTHAHADRERAEQALELARSRYASLYNEQLQPSPVAARIHALERSGQDARTRIQEGDAQRQQLAKDREAERGALDLELDGLSAKLADVDARTHRSRAQHRGRCSSGGNYTQQGVYGYDPARTTL